MLIFHHLPVPELQGLVSVSSSLAAEADACSAAAFCTLVPSFPTAVLPLELLSSQAVSTMPSTMPLWQARCNAPPPQSHVWLTTATMPAFLGPRHDCVCHARWHLQCRCTLPSSQHLRLLLIGHLFSLCVAILGGVKCFECSILEKGAAIWQSWLESFLAAHLTWHGIMEAWLISTC